MLDSIVRRGARLLVPFAFAAAALAACSESPTESGRFVRITTDRAEYQAGTSGTATVTNVSDLPVLYNLCEREIQRRTPAGWVAVSRKPGDEGFVCVGVLLTLQPGASTGAGFVLRADLPAGSYRVRFPGLLAPEGDASASAQATPPFRVEPGIVLH
jgi:hypothetical protein